MQRLRAAVRLACQARSLAFNGTGSEGAAALGSRLLSTTSGPTPVARSLTLGTAAAVLCGGAVAAYAGPGPAAHAEKSSPTPGSQQPPENRYEIPRGGVQLPQTIVLYQYEVCPFCCKVKAFLDYHNIPYTCVEVNPLTKAELKWSDYKKVPVAVLDGVQYNDSSLIISHLTAALAAPAPEQGWRSWLGLGDDSSDLAAAKAAAEVERWRRWVDARFVRVVTVNIYRSAREAWQAFDYMTENGNFGLVQREAARVVGSTLMWVVSGRLKKKYDIDGDVRAELYADAQTWVTGLKGQTFHGGNAPDLADLAVFGVVRSVTGTDTFNDLLHSTGIGAWYEAMFKAVGDSSRLPA